jgi:hypothetical protein
VISKERFPNQIVSIPILVEMSDDPSLCAGGRCIIGLMKGREDIPWRAGCEDSRSIGYSSNGVLAVEGRTRPYATRYTHRDTIAILINTKDDVVSFSVNSENGEVASAGLLQQWGECVIVISICFAAVTILPPPGPLRLLY